MEVKRFLRSAHLPLQSHVQIFLTHFILDDVLKRKESILRMNNMKKKESAREYSIQEMNLKK